MQTRRLDLSDLLTASGSAMGCANLRLQAANAPALLREFTLGLDFQADFCVPRNACTVVLRNVSRPNGQQAAMMNGSSSNVKIEATFIAAPSLVPVPPAGGVACP